MFYKITADKNSTDQIVVSEKFLKDAGNLKRNWINIKAGNNNAKVELVGSSELENNEVLLSENIQQELMIPENVDYQMIVHKDCIKVGPVIGLLMTNNKSRIGKGSLAKMMNYTLIYPEIRGLLVVFSTDAIDFEKKCIKGYYYDANFKGRGLPWVAGTFPIPDSIFSRTMVSEDIVDRLKEETNNHFFNSNFFNKWEFWKKVSKNKTSIQYLPVTKLYSNFKDIEDIVNGYGAAYLKPLNGTLSRGLYKVTKVREGYGIQPKQGDDITVLSSVEEAEKYVEEITKGYKYIVQQAINPLKVRGRHMDFRVIMQKDETKDWQCTGIVALIGSRGDICTNWGSTAYFEDIFYDEFNFSQQQIYKTKREIVGACKSICETLESSKENYGDLGFDVVVDENFKIWILEANKRHYHTVPLWINDVQTFYQTKSNPIKYAAVQAGFQVY